jgi:hypothetical protein
MRRFGIYERIWWIRNGQSQVCISYDERDKDLKNTRDIAGRRRFAKSDILKTGSLLNV